MPDGGNIGQLNNELMGAYGRDYIDTMGFGDFRALLSSVPDIKISRNRAFSTAPVQIPAEPAEVREAPDDEVGERRRDSRRRKEAAREVAEVIAEVNGEVPAEPAQEESAQPGGSAPAEKVQPEPESQPAEKEYEKPELNTVKREILQFVASSENGGSLSRLGGILGAKYGHDFLKQLGFSSMRKLAAEITGTVVKNNKLYISDEFAKQTEEIEQFVNEFARSDGSHSVRALGIKLKERFEGFDYRSYGFARFTDFINAIDGVKADRYHVSPAE